MTKLPPIEKIYEAWSALADGRVQILSPELAKVTSSDHAKVYTIRYNPATDTYQSNDNATVWAGYPGYPIVAVMMAQGRIPYDKEETAQWKDINWTELNKKMKRNYAAAVEQIEQERGIDTNLASQKAQEAMDALKGLDCAAKRLTGVSTSPEKQA